MEQNEIQNPSEIKNCPVCNSPTKKITTKAGIEAIVCPNRVKTDQGYVGCSWVGIWPQQNKPSITIEQINEICPICQNHLVKKTFASGKQAIDCSNKRYDKNTKSNTPDSCSFELKWINN